ncbi:MAG: hypothetical protein E7163_05100 [Firmicutes bacterium]|nr:hypothetical protein [Bacillota bacterium]
MKINTSVVYFLTRALFLGFGLSLTFYPSGKDSYIGALIGLLIGLLITFIYNYILEKKGNITLKELFDRNKKFGFITKILMIIASFIILIYVLVIYKIFVVSFLLVNTPEIYILIPYIILILALTFKGIKIISRVASCLLPISIVLVISSIFSLVGYFEVINFLPIIDTTPLNIFKSAITFAGISTLPNILILHSKGPVKNHILTYCLSALTLIIAIICINGVFGEVLVKAFRFPEYMVLKQLKLLNFIEKVENILSIAWCFDLFITASMATYSIKELLPPKNSKITISIVLIIIMFVISKVFAQNYINELRIYYALPYVAVLIPITLIIPLIYLVRKKTNN